MRDYSYYCRDPFNYPHDLSATLFLSDKVDYDGGACSASAAGRASVACGYRPAI